MKLRVQFTNGEKIINLYWLEFRKKDLYYGYSTSLDQGKYSYHESGQKHKKKDGEIVNIEHCVPLEEIKGVHQLSGFQLENKQIIFDHYDDVKNKEKDACLMIDSRTLPANTAFSVMIGLLEQYNFDRLEDRLLNQLRQLKDQTEQEIKQILICTEVSPWVWVLLLA